MRARRPDHKAAAGKCPPSESKQRHRRVLLRLIDAFESIEQLGEIAQMMFRKPLALLLHRVGVDCVGWWGLGWGIWGPDQSSTKRRRVPTFIRTDETMHWHASALSINIKSIQAKACETDRLVLEEAEVVGVADGGAEQAGVGADVAGDHVAERGDGDVRCLCVRV